MRAGVQLIPVALFRNLFVRFVFLQRLFAEVHINFLLVDHFQLFHVSAQDHLAEGLERGGQGAGGHGAEQLQAQQAYEHRDVDPVEVKTGLYFFRHGFGVDDRLSATADLFFGGRFCGVQRLDLGGCFGFGCGFGLCCCCRRARRR